MRGIKKIDWKLPLLHVSWHLAHFIIYILDTKQNQCGWTKYLINFDYSKEVNLILDTLMKTLIHGITSVNPKYEYM